MDQNENCCRHKHREAEEFNALIRRLSRIEGQVRGVKGMVEKEAYCSGRSEIKDSNEKNDNSDPG